MTMSNQMALSAASVAVEANNATLGYMGAAQRSFFDLEGSTINAGLEATSLQAAAEEKSIIDQADAQRINAGCQISGAMIGIAATGVGMYTGYSANKQAENLEGASTEMQLGLKAVPEAPGTELKTISSTPPSTPVVPPTEDGQEATLSGSLDSSIETSTGKVQAQLDTSTVTEDDGEASDARKALNAKEANATDQTKKATAVSEEAKQNAEKIRTSAKTQSDMISSFGNSIGTVVTSSSGFASYNTTIDQATQTKIKDLEAGLTQALNTEVGLIIDQLRSFDSARGNTYQLMSTLQHVQG